MNEYTPNGVQRGAVARRASEPPDMLVEALTKREREILELIGTGASNQDIAQALVLARDTIKKHVYHIFGKLGVRNRIQAVVKAQALSLHYGPIPKQPPLFVPRTKSGDEHNAWSMATR